MYSSFSKKLINAVIQNKVSSIRNKAELRKQQSNLRLFDQDV